MSEALPNIASRLWPRVCERITHNLHDLGIAIVPILCDKLIWIALAVLIAFLILTIVQAIMLEVL